MATVAFTRSVELLHDAILAPAHSGGLEPSLSIRPRLLGRAEGTTREMNLHTEAALKRQLAHLLLQILSSQLTSEAPLMRQRRLCKMLTAIVLADVMHTVRIDRIHRTLTESRSQHPDLLNIARQLDEFMQAKKEELIDYVWGSLKHPERSRLEFPQELIDILAKHRDDEQDKEAAAPRSGGTKAKAKRLKAK